MFILVNPKLGKIWSNTLTKNKMNKIIKNYVINGMMAECKEVFLERLALLLNEKDLDLLTTGVAVDATIVNSKELAAKLVNSADRIFKSAEVVNVAPNGEVEVNYKYVELLHFANQEDVAIYKKTAYSNGRTLTLRTLEYTDSDIIVESSVKNSNIRFGTQEAKLYFDIEYK